MHDINEDILVVKKSEYQNNNIGNEYFVVPKEEWYYEDNGLKSCHLFLTKVDGNRISLFLTSKGNPVIFRKLPLSQRSYYIEI